jgi:hypothetical protein
VGEHALHLDLDSGRLRYARVGQPPAGTTYEVRVVLRRDGKPVGDVLTWPVTDGGTLVASGLTQARTGDVVAATLWSAGRQIGTEVNRTLGEGAPFTFGRALGLGKEERGHGSQLDLSGVAVFNRVLSAAELKALAFVP